LLFGALTATLRRVFSVSITVGEHVGATGKFEVLLVEDNPADVLLTEDAFRDGRIAHRLISVPDADEALQYLHREGKYSDAKRPDVILLDLNLPKKDGRELLSVLKNDPELRYIPVIVLTTSTAEQDVSAAYKLHANCYLTKPVQVEEFIRKIRSLEGFWLTVVRLPAR
jgi:chemotaxis family two-component system response regulator Rcp1